MSRPSWKEYFFAVCELNAKMSTCVKRSVGAIIVDPISKRIIATGFNGAPSKVKHCTADTCLRKDIPSGEQLHRCRACHGEGNCLAQAAKYGIPVNGMVMYCTHKPCIDCTKLLINAGIKTVYYLNDYPSDLTESMVNEADVELQLVHVTLHPKELPVA